jgi:acyl carrier protein
MEGKMTEKTVETRVKAIVAELLGIEDVNGITLESNFRDDLDADSLDLVELIMEFEKEFGGEINDEDVQKIETVGQAVTYIQERM